MEVVLRNPSSSLPMSNCFTQFLTKSSQKHNVAAQEIGGESENKWHNSLWCIESAVVFHDIIKSLMSGWYPVLNFGAFVLKNLPSTFYLSLSEVKGDLGPFHTIIEYS